MTDLTLALALVWKMGWWCGFLPTVGMMILGERAVSPDTSRLSFWATSPPPEKKESQVSRLLMHYAIPSEGLPKLAKVGIVDIAIFAWRCGLCKSDFHLDQKPKFCPECGTEFTGEERFGEPR